MERFLKERKTMKTRKSKIKMTKYIQKTLIYTEVTLAGVNTAKEEFCTLTVMLFGKYKDEEIEKAVINHIANIANYKKYYLEEELALFEIFSPSYIKDVIEIPQTFRIPIEDFFEFAGKYS